MKFGIDLERVFPEKAEDRDCQQRGGEIEPQARLPVQSRNDDPVTGEKQSQQQKPGPVVRRRARPLSSTQSFDDPAPDAFSPLAPALSVEQINDGFRPLDLTSAAVTLRQMKLDVGRQDQRLFRS